MKNEFSESEMEEDEEEQLVEAKVKTGNHSLSYPRPPHATARKKRRGIIEKRRRDRINNCLSELRRMVPTAYEKQGSTKLEKAEILQLTVEHLKILQSAMNKGYFDDLSSRTDYKSSGFRECVSEVARYLMTMEGMDLQNPLRVRLMNHLQHLLKQKEAVCATAKNFRLESPLWPTFVSLSRTSNNNMASDLYTNLHRHSPYSIPHHPAMVPMFSQAIMNKMIADQTTINLSQVSPVKHFGRLTKKEHGIKSSATPFIFPNPSVYHKTKEAIPSTLASIPGKMDLSNFNRFGHNIPILNPLLNFTGMGNTLGDFSINRLPSTTNTKTQPAESKTSSTKLSMSS